MTDAAVRVQLVLLPPVVLALLGAGAAAGGAWLAVVVPAAALLATHAAVVARTEARAWLPALGNAALVVAGVAIVGLAVLPALGLYRTVTVLSGSMRPTFGPGDVVVMTPEAPSALRAGQVISFHAPIGRHQVETHRVAAVLRPGPEPVVQTKGDANAGLDPWRAQLHGQLWRYRLRVPLLGYPLLGLREPWVRRGCVLLLPALLALWGLARVWRPAGPRALEHA